MSVEMAVSRNTWSLQMIGVAVPRPGTCTFHFTPLVSLQWIGGLAVGEIPLPRGPRQAGQFASTVGTAPYAALKLRALAAKVRISFMKCSDSLSFLGRGT